MRTYRLAWMTLCVTFLLIVAGGLVHSTGSALACPDWPLCYGKAFPTLAGGILYEHGHRYIGTIVGLLVLALALALIWRWPGPERWWGVAAWSCGSVQALLVGRFGIVASRPETNAPVGLLAGAIVLGLCILAVAALLARRTGDWLPFLGLGLGELVLFQATLGGITVLLKLPTVVSTLHLATSVLILCSLTGMVFALKTGPRTGDIAGPRGAIIVMAVLTYTQIIIGALVRHTGAGLACNAHWLACNDSWLPQGGPAWLVSTHRWFGLFVAVALLVLARGPHRTAVQAVLPGAWRLARLVGIIAVLQVLLGAITISTYISIPVATLHLSGAAILMIALVALYLCLGPLGAPHPDGKRSIAARLLDSRGLA